MKAPKPVAPYPRACMKLIALSVVFCLALVIVAAATAAPPPDPMLGTWTRIVTKADVKRAHSKNVVAGSKWTLVIGKETSRATSPGTKGRALRSGSRS